MNPDEPLDVSDVLVDEDVGPEGDLVARPRDGEDGVRRR
jgi:hypothetical protein